MPDVPGTGTVLRKDHYQFGQLSNLPTEIVAHVFDCCLPSPRERLSTPLHRLAPLVLTWTCRSWRSLCLSFPSLWTELAIGHRATDAREDAKIVELWVERSGKLPISLVLNYNNADVLHPVLFHLDREREERYLLGTRDLLHVVARCIERISSLEIHALDISVLDPAFLALVTRGSPYLTTLSFSTKYLGFFGDVYVLEFSLCPALREVCLRTPMISPVFGPGEVMRNMRRLELRFCPSIEDCLKWIDICPALEELTVRLFASTLDWTLLDDDGVEVEQLGLTLENRSIRYLPQLRSLELHTFSSEVDVGPLLDVLDLPALEVFTINMYDMIDPPPPTSLRRWTHVLDLIRRSEPKLETFQVLGTPMTVEDVIECLQLIPTVKQLAVGIGMNRERGGNTHVLVQALIVSHEHGEPVNADQQCLCPLLEVLDLTHCPCSIDLLASLVSSRCPPAPPNHDYIHVGTSNKSSNSSSEKKIARLRELRLDVQTTQHTRQHPVIAERMIDERGLKIVERDTNMLRLAFDSDDVYFV